MRYELMLAIMLAGLAGCNDKPKNQAQPPQMIKEQRQALDQAKDVGDTLAQQAEAQRKQLEEATK